MLFFSVHDSLFLVDFRSYISLGVKDFSLGDQMNILRNFWNKKGREMRDIIGRL